MTERPLRIVIAEDNYLVREGIRQLLEGSGEVEVLLDAVGRLGPDAVITDIREAARAPHRGHRRGAGHPLVVAHRRRGGAVRPSSLVVTLPFDRADEQPPSE